MRGHIFVEELEKEFRKIGTAGRTIFFQDSNGNSLAPTGDFYTTEDGTFVQVEEA